MWNKHSSYSFLVTNIGKEIDYLPLSELEERDPEIFLSVQTEYFEDYELPSPHTGNKS